MADQPSYRLQTMLQTAVQSVGWTYSLFWQLCPQQGILVWGDGYYNGAIKTRKTVQSLMEFSTEEASLHRSEQLRELYDSLATTTTTTTGSDINQQPAARRPSAALSPEDLTESEWFYLMCVSFSFPPCVGLPGKAYARRKHVWLTGATDVDSKVFSRALLAKSARIQTVVCIPLLDGVIELGTTEKVQEDLGFVKQVMTFFTDHTNWSLPPKPALSGHSTSNSAISPTMPPPAIYTPPVVPMDQELEDDLQEHEADEIDDNKEVGEDDDQEDELDGEEEEEELDDEEEEEEEEAAESDDAEAETGYNIDSRFSTVQNLQAMADHNQDHDANTTSTDHHHDHHAVVEPNELHDLSEGIRFGSPDDGSNYLDSDFHMLAVGQAENFESELQQQGYNPFSPKYCLQLPGAPQPEELTQEDTHYSHTVSTILHHQSNRCSDASTVSRYAIYSTQSAFAKWKSPPPIPHHPGPSQWVLKYVLFTIPYLHTTKSRDGAAATESGTRFRKGDDTSHVLAERRRREKLNERFIILRSLVPFVTKMDKASILGDTIEYLKQLRKRIQDLEAREGRSTGSSAEKRKVRKMDGTVVEKTKAMMEAASAGEVEVSIIESDALVEMQCPYREGLLLDVMEVLRELRVEITTVQSSLTGRLFTAEMRAKVKENVSGKKLSIMEVKRAINRVIPKNY